MIFSLLCFAYVLFDFSLSNWSRIKGKESTAFYHPLLDSLAQKALMARDVPVAACLVYKNRVIGMGWNTVRADHDLRGHAELNAMNDALRTLGAQAFDDLDRSDLKLITTFEPCLMCQGAAIEQGITYVVSVLPKKSKDRWERYKKLWKYRFRSALGDDPRFQYDLFKKHPEFDTLDYPFLK